MAGGGEHHDGGSGEVLFGPDTANEVETVGVGHVHVCEDKTVGFADAVGAEEAIHGSIGTVRCIRLHPPAGEHAIQDAAVGGVVVDDEDTHVAHPFSRSREGAGEAGDAGAAEQGGEGKRASDAELAGYMDGALHGFDEARRDGEAKAGAAVATGGGGVGLGEGFEDVIELVGGDADSGVGDAEAEKVGVVGLAEVGDLCGDGERYFSALREFEGIANEVDDDLAQAG